MEADLYKEMLEEQGVGQMERIDKGLEEYGKAVNEGLEDAAFHAIIGKMKHQRKLLFKSMAGRQDMILKRYQAVLAKYPDTMERIKNRNQERDLQKIIEDREAEDDDEEEDDDDAEDEEDDEAHEINQGNEGSNGEADKENIQQQDEEEDDEGDFDTYKKEAGASEDISHQ